MPSRQDGSIIVEPLRSEALALRDYLARVESLYQRRLLHASDVDKAYEGALLTWNTTLERQLEALFLGLLVGRLRINGGRVRPRLRADTTQVAFEVLKGKGNFVDWLPINNTTDRARAVLAGGRPFDLLEPADYEAFAAMHKIRNAIAHRSGPAMKRFRKELVADRGLPASQRTPAGYLRGSHTSGVTRLLYYVTQTTGAMNRMCSKRTVSGGPTS